MAIKLNGLLRLDAEKKLRIKIRFNAFNGHADSIDQFKADPSNFLLWNYWNNKKYEMGDISIGLARVSGNDCCFHNWDDRQYVMYP